MTAVVPTREGKRAPTSPSDCSDELPYQFEPLLIFFTAPTSHGKLLNTKLTLFDLVSEFNRIKPTRGRTRCICYIFITTQCQLQLQKEQFLKRNVNFISFTISVHYGENSICHDSIKFVVVVPSIKQLRLIREPSFDI